MLKDLLEMEKEIKSHLQEVSELKSTIESIREVIEVRQIEDIKERTDRTVIKDRIDHDMKDQTEIEAHQVQDQVREVVQDQAVLDHQDQALGQMLDQVQEAQDLQQEVQDLQAEDLLQDHLVAQKEVLPKEAEDSPQIK